MRFITFLLIFISFSVINPATARSAAPGASGEASETSCYANCVSMTRSGDKLLFVARNSQGQLLATANLQLPAGARPVIYPGGDRDERQSSPYATRQSGLPVGSVCAGVAGVCTEHSSLTYETPSQYVVVSITYFFFNGELQDIDVDETRIAKSKVK